MDSAIAEKVISRVSDSIMYFKDHEMPIEDIVDEISEKLISERRLKRYFPDLVVQSPFSDVGQRIDDEMSLRFAKDLESGKFEKYELNRNLSVIRAEMISYIHDSSRYEKNPFNHFYHFVSDKYE